MTAIEILKDEHRVIEQVLTCLDKIADRAEHDSRLAAEPARDALDLLRNFADRCHHGKEEDQLFPLMEARGLPREAGPTAVMRHEHVAGRTLIGSMTSSLEQAAAGSAPAVRTFVTAARDYTDLLRQHIAKEDQVLFPMAERMLSPSDLDDLLARFDRVEVTEMGEGVHERYLARARALAQQFGVEPVPIGTHHCGCSGQH